MKLKQTTTAVLYNQNGFTKPFFFINDETFYDLVEHTKEQIKELDMSWNNDEELKEIIHEGISQLCNSEMEMYDMFFLEGLVAVWCDINGYMGNEHIISMNFSKNNESSSSTNIQIPYKFDERVLKSVKGVYKNEDTLVDVKLQSEVVKWVTIITTDKLMKTQLSQSENQTLDENYHTTKIVMVQLANLIQLIPDKKEEFESILQMVSELKENYEDEIMDKKINNLLS